jgi:thiol-disulfide isomerase/thioredoxin
MLRRHAFVASLSAVVLASAGIALAEPDTKKSDAPATTPAPAKAPAKKPEPKKDEGKDKEKAGATLKVGSKAPALKVEKWLKGSEVKGFDAGKVYVVEFWATWCPPCRKSIPHLTEIQKSHKADGLTVIGITSSERKDKDGTDNREKKARDFVTQQGDQMNYTVGYDGSRDMGRAWLEAAGINSIPTAFVVDGAGTITWIGNPLDTEAMEAAITKAIAAAKNAKAQTPPPISPAFARA